MLKYPTSQRRVIALLFYKPAVHRNTYVTFQRLQFREHMDRWSREVWKWKIRRNKNIYIYTDTRHFHVHTTRHFHQSLQGWSPDAQYRNYKPYIHSGGGEIALRHVWWNTGTSRLHKGLGTYNTRALTHTLTQTHTHTRTLKYTHTHYHTQTPTHS